MDNDFAGALFEFAVVFCAILLPLALIARRTGRSPFLAAWALVPVIGLILVLRTLAYGRWPAEERR